MEQIRTRSAEWTAGIGEPTTGLETDSKSGPVTVESVAVRVSRSLKGYPFQPKMNIDHYKQMEVKSSFIYLCVILCIRPVQFFLDKYLKLHQEPWAKFKCIPIFIKF